MKLRHAAALALVGWYLMVPPPKVAGRLLVDLDAPLSKWTVYNPYETAAECAQGHVDFGKKIKENLTKEPTQDNKMQYQQIISAQCIASNDPRLNSK
jgi:hypothetical protein